MMLGLWKAVKRVDHHMNAMIRRIYSPVRFFDSFRMHDDTKL
jgi:hypothetical protein